MRVGVCVSNPQKHLFLCQRYKSRCGKKMTRILKSLGKGRIDVVKELNGTTPSFFTGFDTLTAKYEMIGPLRPFSRSSHGPHYSM